MKGEWAVLRARIGALEGARDRGFASVDGGEVDRWLGGGLARGRVHAVAGPAATAFAVVLCARLRGPILWCAVEGGVFPRLYPPGLADLGLDPRRLVMVRADEEGAALGAAETGLREPGLAAVVVETAGGLPSARGRRLQLAAETGGGLGLVLPGKSGDLGWAESGWEAAPVPGRGRVPRWRWTLGRVRRTRPHEWLVERDDATGAVRVVSPVGDGMSDPNEWAVPAGRRADGDRRAWRHGGGGGVGSGRSCGGEARHEVGGRPGPVPVPGGRLARSRA